MLDVKVLTTGKQCTGLDRRDANTVRPLFIISSIPGSQI